jgi:hypothetical protein
MGTEKLTPAVAGDFALIPVQEYLQWRDALAVRVLNQLGLPDWKKQEQREPINMTIASLMDKGMTDPAAIEKQILSIGSARKHDAPS